MDEAPVMVPGDRFRCAGSVAEPERAIISHRDVPEVVIEQAILVSQPLEPLPIKAA
jgi:hypothetical protein